MGTKGRPFYRVVVAKSTAGRNGAFIETIGTYDPVVKPTSIKLDEARAMHWLRLGAQPTETTAHILSKTGLLDKFFSERPSARKGYAFLDKRTAASSVRSVMDKPEKEKPAAKAEEPVPVEVESSAEPEDATTEQQPDDSATDSVAEPEVEPEPVSAEVEAIEAGSEVDGSASTATTTDEASGEKPKENE